MSRSETRGLRLTTAPVASSILSADVAKVIYGQASVDGFVRLGYPLHFGTLSEQDALAGGRTAGVTAVAEPLPL